jgi:hypothetical protein
VVLLRLLHAGPAEGRRVPAWAEERPGNHQLAELIPGTTARDCAMAAAPLWRGAGIHALCKVARGAPAVLMPPRRH